MSRTKPGKGHENAEEFHEEVWKKREAVAHLQERKKAKGEKTQARHNYGFLTFCEIGLTDSLFFFRFFIFSFVTSGLVDSHQSVTVHSR